MAKTRLNIALIGVIMGQLLFADSLKTAEFVNSSNVLRMVKFYHSKTGNLPSSWREVERLVDFEKLFKNFTFKSKFGFPNENLQITYGGDKFRIVVMSIDSNYSQDLDIAGKASRIILIHNNKENFAVVHMAEDALLGAFDRAENSLTDYTGISGKWANTEELTENQDHPREQSAPTDGTTNSNAHPELEREIPEPKSITEEFEGITPKSGWLLAVLAFGGVGILVFSFLKWKGTTKR